MALLLCAAPAMAKEKMIPLTTEDAAGLQGKRIALTVHEAPSFIAMTAGKAGFGLLGMAAMASAGNQLVKDNGIADPAIAVRESLTAILAPAYGATFLAADTTQTDRKKPADLAALHKDADYVLDVRSGGWNYGYFAAQWGEYWVGYSVQVQLIDTASGRLVSDLACNANTQQDTPRPTRDALHGDGARLLKHATQALGARCVQLLAREQFHVPEAAIPVLSADLQQPLRLPGAVESAPAAAAAAAEAGATGSEPSEVAPAAPMAPAAPASPETAPVQGGA